jgi:hypothetical protein
VTGFELVAGVIGIFFIAGIVMGVLIVTVFPWWRARKYMNGGDWRELPPPRDNDDGPQRWPGE